MENEKINKMLADAVYDCDFEEVKRLIEEENADVNYKNAYCVSIASEKDQIEILAYLLTKKPDLSKNSAIYYAVGNGNHDIVSMLLNYDKDVMRKYEARSDTYDYYRLFTVALRHKHFDLARLVRANCDLEKNNINSALIACAENGNTESLNFILDEVFDYYTSSDKNDFAELQIATMRAVENRRLEATKLLINRAKNEDDRKRLAKSALYELWCFDIATSKEIRDFLNSVVKWEDIIITMF